MTNYFFDATHPLPQPGANALVELGDAGTAFIGVDIVTATGIALMTQAKQRITIAETFKVRGAGNAMEVKGVGSVVHNDGTIQSDAGIGIRFSAAGTGSVVNYGTITGVKGIVVDSAGAPVPSAADKLDIYNRGTISASGIAILGGTGDDRISNAGLIKTTGADESVTIIDLGAGNDFYDGTQGTVTGCIELGAGDDTAYGGKGSETFSGAGSNYIDGGGGIDTIDYSWASAAVTFNLSLSVLQWTGFQFDQVLNVENVLGSAKADRLTGSDAANKLVGGEGNDTLEGGFGSDTLDGGGGSDTARYTGSSAVTVSLAIAGAQNTGFYGSDTLIGIENLEGGSGADTFTGNDGDNKLVGNGGNDTLNGGKGNDTLEGGAGVDTAVFSGAKGDYTITKNSDGSVTIADAQGAQRDGTDLLKDIRFAKFGDNQTIALVNGNPSSIFLSTSSVLESTQVGATVATLFGSDPDGDDLTYQLSSNPDGLFGLDSTGEKIVLAKALDYEKATQHTISVTANDAYGGTYTKTFTINVRNVVETTPLTRYGTAKAEQLTGEAGNDQLFGLDGKDTLFGEAGNDTLNGGTGSDVLAGGTGADVFVFDRKLSVKSNLDYIQDFVPKDDVIHLSRKVFSKISKGTLSSKAFVVGDHFKDKDDRILYFKKQGALFYDPDGSGSAKAIQFANVTKNLKVTHKDFFIF